MWRYLRAGLSFVLFRVPWLLLPLMPILAFALWIRASASSFLFVQDMEVVRGTVALTPKENLDAVMQSTLASGVAAFRRPGPRNDAGG
jgi:hypothetical protein